MIRKLEERDVRRGLRLARRMGWTLSRGDYVDTPDNRLDEWYWAHETEKSVDRTGRGERYRREAVEAFFQEMADGRYDWPHSITTANAFTEGTLLEMLDRHTRDMKKALEWLEPFMELPTIALRLSTISCCCCAIALRQMRSLPRLRLWLPSTRKQYFGKT